MPLEQINALKVELADIQKRLLTVELSMIAKDERFTTFQNTLSKVEKRVEDVTDTISDLAIVKRIVYGIAGLVLLSFGTQVIRVTTEQNDVRMIKDYIISQQRAPLK